MLEIRDFTENELWIIRSALKERYAQDILVELAETEIRIRPGAKDLTPCPAAYWEARGAHFILVKTGESRYRCQFYYRLHEMFGTGIEEFDDLGDCVVALLQVQADHESQRQS